MRDDTLDAQAAQQRAGNAIRSVVLLVALFGIVFVLAYGGCLIAISDMMIAGSVGSHEVTNADEPALFIMTRSLCERAEMAMPRLAVIEVDACNAFASGSSEDQG